METLYHFCNFPVSLNVQKKKINRYTIRTDTSQKIYEWQKKTCEKVLKKLVIREMQIKPQFQFTTSRIAKLKKTDNTKWWQEWGATVNTYTC